MGFRAGVLLAAACMVSGTMPAAAQGTRQDVVRGSGEGLSWQAGRRLVGVNSTATLQGGGDPRYIPTSPAVNGVVAIIMEYTQGAFICTGSLLPDRLSILTAGHCVSEGVQNGVPVNLPLRTTAWFTPASPPDLFFNAPPQAVPVPVTSYAVPPDYTGEVIDQNDIAVLRLGDAAPAFAPAYELFTDDPIGNPFTVLGFGARSLEGGEVGANLGVGRRRQGQNRIDFAFNDPVFGGFFTAPDTAGMRFFGSADPGTVLLADFDNGTAATDASCLLVAEFVAVPPARVCDPGRGADEVAVAGGDSGGPQFIGGRIAGVTSFGLTFGPEFGDIDEDLNSTFGEFSGFTSTAFHAQFIGNYQQYLVVPTVVPEPSTYLLLATGLGGVLMAWRRCARR